MIILITGTDAFRIRAFRDSLRKSAEVKYGGALAVHDVTLGLDGETSGVAALSQISTSGSLFSSHTLVFINEPLAEAEALAEFLKARPSLEKAEDTVLAVLAPMIKSKKGQVNDNSPEAEKNVLEYLKKRAKVVKRFDALSQEGLVAWLNAYAAEHGVKIEPAAATLVSQASADTWQAVSILERVAAYAGGAVTAAAVQALVPPRLESRIFVFLDALATRQPGPALRALHRELASGSAGLQLVAMLAYQLRVLTIVRSLLDKKTAFSKLAKESGLNPFVIQKATRAAGRFTLAELQDLYRRLVELHLALRRSPLPAATLLEQFIFAVALPART